MSSARDAPRTRWPWRAGRTDIAELLVELGAAPVAGEADLLIGACMRGDRAAALARLERDPGLATSARRDLGRALIIAAGEGRVEAAALLLDTGAPLDARDEMGGSPLHVAAWNGRGGTVDLLLRRGADPVAVAPPPTSSTPLAWAAHGSRYAGEHGDAYYGIGRRLVAEGAVRDPALADLADRPARRLARRTTRRNAAGSVMKNPAVMELRFNAARAQAAKQASVDPSASAPLATASAARLC